MSNLPEKVYTEAQVDRARNTAQFVGWLQGAGVVVGGVVLWNLMGWIPVVLALGAVLWVLYKVLGGRTGDGADEA
ncbi:MAG: hypothetical protein R3253_09090 [Longimicrobiales bacterium]|nr:hypothetical protein [Longimicrobiales bacterium]